MLSKKIEDALLAQVAMESYSSNSYLAMASWCGTNGFRGIASFLNAQSEEERAHMKKLIQYINEADGHAVIPAIKEPQNHFKSIFDVFEAALKQEQAVTKSINKLVELTFGFKDYASFNFLQWYVAEQHEEEHTMLKILDKIRNIGEAGSGVYFIDRAIGELAGQK